MPIFSNPSSLWALFVLPAIVAVHYLQQKSRRQITSTLFLLEALSPESRRGRRWDKLRNSKNLWFQLLAACFLIWVLSGPRWLLETSSQTVVLVMDDSAAMSAFREEAISAAKDRMLNSLRRAAHTEWVVMTTDSRTPNLYRGDDYDAAVKSLDQWQPELGTHDKEPALDLASALAGPHGLSWLITDRRAGVRTGQAAVGVGSHLDNVGFAGARVSLDGNHSVWRAMVKNHGTQPVRRQWWVEIAGTQTEPGTVEIAPGALVELTGVFPESSDRLELVMTPDRFALDDRVALVRPKPKPLPYAIGEMDKETGAFFEKVFSGVEGTRKVPLDQSAMNVATYDMASGYVGAAIWMAPDSDGEPKVEHAPVVPEKNELVEHLNWQGLVGPGPAGLSESAEDTVLLWQAGRPLVWLHPTQTHVPQLILNVNWKASNAARLPAMVLLLRRYVEQVQREQPGAYAANFDTGEPVLLTQSDRLRSDLVLEVSDDKGGPSRLPINGAEAAVLRSPLRPGWFRLLAGSENKQTLLVDGAAQFGDPRQGDFSDSETYDQGPPRMTEVVRERNTRKDPLTACWLMLSGLLLLGSWWPGRRER